MFSRERLERITAVLLLSATMSACGDVRSTYSASQVSEGFANAGLTLKPTEIKASDVVNPSGGPLPIIAFNPRKKLGFYVILYSSAKNAKEIAATADPIDPVFKEKREFLRSQNVIVVIQPPNRGLEQRIRGVLGGL